MIRARFGEDKGLTSRLAMIGKTLSLHDASIPGCVEEAGGLSLVRARRRSSPIEKRPLPMRPALENVQRWFYHMPLTRGIVHLQKAMSYLLDTLS